MSPSKLVAVNYICFEMSDNLSSNVSKFVLFCFKRVNPTITLPSTEFLTIFDAKTQCISHLYPRPQATAGLKSQDLTSDECRQYQGCAGVLTSHQYTVMNIKLN